MPMHTAFDGQYEGIDWTEIGITAKMKLTEPVGEFNGPVIVTRTTQPKCERCWRHLPKASDDSALCSRCDQVVNGMDAPA